MTKMKRILALSLMAVTLSGCAVSAAELPDDAALVTATAYMDTLPESWDQPDTPEENFLRSLTAGTLYDVSDDGAVLPQLAEAAPTDVTAEYAGTFGIGGHEVRGYAFRIDLNPDAAWEDGTPITAQDYYDLAAAQLADSGYTGFLLSLANAKRCQQGMVRESGEVISLKEAGFSTVADAKAAGVTEFYVSMSDFWGLEAGWESVTDRTRIQDYAIASGIGERYVSPAYIYENYLAEGKMLEAFQDEAVGVCSDRTQLWTMEDVGIQVTGERQLTLILEQPTTAAALALKLEALILENGGLSSGPYRVAETSDREIRLERNPHWCGETEAGSADVISCRPAD